MPIIAYSCAQKHVAKKFYRSHKDAPSVIACECGLEMKKLLSPPSQKSTVIVDNGVQSRRVEINLETIEANKARSEKDYREE